MNTPRHSAPPFPALLWTLLLPLLPLPAFSGCRTGSGSDIGPFLPQPPASTHTVTIVDQAGRPVTAARGQLGPVAAGSGRAGRMEFANPRAGSTTLDVLGATGSSTGPESFADFRLRAAVSGGHDERVAPVVLPDLKTGIGTSVLLGPQPADVVLTLGTTTLTIRSGSTVARPGATGAVTVTLVALAAEDLPQPLPLSGSGAWVAGRAFLVHPPDLEVAPGAVLEVQNDLGMNSAQTARLFRLVPATGDWEDAAAAALGTDGRIRTDRIAGGGLWCFAIPAALVTTATGNVKTPSGAPVRGALVAGPAGVSTRADGSGVFFLGGLPAVDAAGAPATFTLSVTAPMGYRFARAKVAVTAADQGFTVPDQTLDSFETGTIQALSIFRGRVDPLRQVSASAALGATAEVAVTGSDGLVVLQDMELGHYGTRLDYVKGENIVRGEPRFRLEDALADIRLIAVEVDPREGENPVGTVLVGDETGRGPVSGALAMLGSAFPPKDSGTTGDEGSLFIGDVRLNNLTVAVATKRGGVEVVSNYTVVNVDNPRIEAPVLRAHLSPGGPFVRHGLLAGTITGSAGAGTTRRLSSFGTILHYGWRSADFAGVSLAAAVPKKLDPELTGGDAFRIGVPVGPAAVVVQEGTLAAGAFTLERLGAVFLAGQDGVETLGDIALSVPVASPLALPGAAGGLDARIASSDLRVHLGELLADGTALELARDLAGNVARSGNDLVLTVPPAAAFGGTSRLAFVSGTAAAAGVTVRQGALAVAPAPAPPPGFLDVPAFVTPAPDATVAASGFEARWTVPAAGTSFQVLELVSATSTKVLRWSVLLPPETVSFQFFRLLDQAPKALAPGQTYRLTITCQRVTEGFAFGRGDLYQRILGTMVGLRRGDQGVTSVSSASITVTSS